MSLEVQMDPSEWASLQRHLLKGRREQVAFALSEFAESEGSERFVVKEIGFADDADFDVQSEFHITLTDDALARLIKRAWDLRLSVVELHSHPMWHGHASFSPSDLAGLEDHVPYMFWRLRGRPYAAIVVSQGAVDALAWIKGPEDLRALDRLRIGEDIVELTQETITHLEQTDGKIR